MNLFELIELKKKCIIYGKRKDLYRVSRKIREKVDYSSKDYKKRKEKVKTIERRKYYDQY